MRSPKVSLKGKVYESVWKIKAQPLKDTRIRAPTALTHSLSPAAAFISPNRFFPAFLVPIAGPRNWIIFSLLLLVASVASVKTRTQLWYFLAGRLRF